MSASISAAPNHQDVARSTADFPPGFGAHSFLTYTPHDTFEQSRMHVPSSVECNMKQYGVTKQEAYDELNKHVEKAWKEINQECLKPIQLPMTVTIRALNFTCVEDIVYKDEDEFNHVQKLLKDLIALMLVDPVLI